MFIEQISAFGGTASHGEQRRHPSQFPGVSLVANANHSKTVHELFDQCMICRTGWKGCHLLARSSQKLGARGILRNAGSRLIGQGRCRTAGYRCATYTDSARHPDHSRAHQQHKRRCTTGRRQTIVATRPAWGPRASVGSVEECAGAVCCPRSVATICSEAIFARIPGVPTARQHPFTP